MIGILSHDEIDAVLRRQRVSRLACSADDRPYREGRKVHVLREQPLVCFEIEESIGLANWRRVVVEGVDEELTDEAARRTSFGRLAPTDGRAVAPRPDASGRSIVFRLRPLATSGWFERHDAQPEA